MGRSALVALAVALPAAQLAAAAGGGTWWGLHHLRYLGPGAIALAIASAALVSLGLARAPATPRSGRSDLVAAGLALAVFWLLRDRAHVLGDGSVILRGAGDPALWHPREPLATRFGAAVIDAGSALGLSAGSALELSSCLLGAGLVFLLARLDRRLGGGGAIAVLAGATGVAQLFFGYVEHYPVVAFAVVAFLVAARGPAGRPATLLPGLGLFALALLSHLSSICLVPALAWLVVRQVRLRPTPGARAVIAAEVGATIVAAFLAWGIAFRGVGEAGTLPDYLALLARSRDFTHAAAAAATPDLVPGLLSRRHVFDFLQLWLLLAPVQLAALALVVPRTRELLSDPWLAFLAIAALCFAAAQFHFFAYLGPPRDWDVLAVGAVPVGLLAGAGLRAIGRLDRATGAVLGGLAVWHLLVFVLGNASGEAARRRFEELPLPAGQAAFALGTAAFEAGEWNEAVRRLEQATEEAPGGAPAWFLLGQARERRDDWEGARLAYRQVVALHERDSRAPRGEALERLGLACWRTGRTEEAGRAFRAALEERPGSLSARVFLAIAALDDGDAAAASALLDPVWQRRAENPLVYVLTARALAGLGRTDEALERLREGVAAFPGDASVEAELQRLAASSR